MVKVNDQIVEVDGRSLHGYTNQEAVEMLRSTGNIVRYRRHYYTQSSSRWQVKFLFLGFPLIYFVDIFLLNAVQCAVGYSDFHNLMGFTNKKMPNNIL